jgi:hypothetical protein
MATITNPDTLVYLAAGPIAACRFVQTDVAGVDYVKQATSVTAYSMGVSRHAADAAGDQVDVYAGGIVKVEASAAITRGVEIASSTDGRAKVAVAGDIVMGISEGPASAAGKFVRVRLAPVGFKKA